MDQPADLSPEQAAELAEVADGLAKRNLAEPTRLYLLELRKLLLLAGVKQSTLARRAADIEGTPPPGRAPIGHTRDGRFSAGRISGELNGSERMPRAALVEAVAVLYAERLDVPFEPVRARLDALRVAGENAHDAENLRRAEISMAEGRRQPTYADLKAERQRHEQTRDHLSDLQERFNRLADTNADNADRLASTQAQLGRLQNEVYQLKLRDIELDAERSRNAELMIVELELRTEIDRLTTDMAVMNQRLQQRAAVREVQPDSPESLPTWSDRAETDQDERQQEKALATSLVTEDTAPPPRSTTAQGLPGTVRTPQLPVETEPEQALSPSPSPTGPSAAGPSAAGPSAAGPGAPETRRPGPWAVAAVVAVLIVSGALAIVGRPGSTAGAPSTASDSPISSAPATTNSSAARALAVGETAMLNTGSIDDIVPTQDNHTVWISELSGETSVLRLVDSTTMSTVAQYPVATRATEMAISPSGDQLYLADDGTTSDSQATMSVFDTAKHVITATIPVGPGPTSPVISPDGRVLYVSAGSKGNQVQVVDTATNTVRTTIDLTDQEQVLAVSRDGRTLYAETTKGVDVIDAATDRRASTIPGGSLPTVLRPDGLTGYSPTSFAGQVATVGADGHKAGPTIQTGGPDIPVGISPDGSRLYLDSRGNSGTTTAVAALDTISNTVTQTFSVPHSNAYATTPDGRLLFLRGPGGDLSGLIVLRLA